MLGIGFGLHCLHGDGRSGVGDVLNRVVDLIDHLLNGRFLLVVVHGAPSVRGFEPIRGAGFAKHPPHRRRGL